MRTKTKAGGRAARAGLAALLLAAGALGCNAPAPTSGGAGPDAGARPDNGGDRETPGAMANGSSRDGGGRPRRSRPDTSAQPGAFDFYLLNLSWSPEFCATHAGSPECGQHLGFVVHGLWPQNTGGTYPEKCSTVPPPADLAQVASEFPTQSLAVHEWETHGTCSGLSGDAYFTTVRTAYKEVKIPASLSSLTQETMLAPDAILGQFAQANPSFPRGSIGVSCGGNRLTAVEVCLSKDLQPEICQGVRTCRANVVKVTPP